VPYGEGPARWSGATYDPTSHYRAVRVFDFFDAEELDAGRLRAISRHQVGLLAAAFDALDLDPRAIARDRATPPEAIGGFLALRAPRAGDLAAALRAEGVMVDSRGDLLRFGPAPYLSDRQLRDAIGRLGRAVRAPA
jgi:kynureninase